MDLALGAKQTFVMMDLFTRSGESKLVPACTYPLTALACVSRVYSDRGVFLLGDGRVRVRETFGTTFAELQDALPEIDLVDGTGSA
jgi:3-oxoadipate CoA-transferase, beta subunit